VGETLVNLNEHGFDVKNILLIGFSLGAHLVGEVGRTVRDVSNKSLTLSKIVGLDPAGPGFFPLNPYLVALNKNDGNLSARYTKAKLAF
jgi:predicted esterase